MNGAQVLWEKQDGIEVWSFNPTTFAKTGTYTSNFPNGYKAKDIETKDGKIFLLLTNQDSLAKLQIITLNGVIEKSFDVVLVGWNANAIEIRSDGKIDLLLSGGDGKAKIVVLNQDGIIESDEEYVGS